MAEYNEESQLKKSTLVPPSYLEVNCLSSSKIRRFSVGTEAGFALRSINKKLDDGLPMALYIESVKEGEESVTFGPNSVLVSYGHGWKLQTVIESEEAERRKKEEAEGRERLDERQRKREEELEERARLIKEAILRGRPVDPPLP